MKRFNKVLLLLTVIAIALLALVACTANGLSGKYESDSVLGTKTVYEFSGGEVKRTIIGELGSKTVVGDYEIRAGEDGGRLIYLDFDDVDDADEVGWNIIIGNGYIEIAGVRYNKVK